MSKNPKDKFEIHRMNFKVSLFFKYLSFDNVISHRSLTRWHRLLQTYKFRNRRGVHHQVLVVKKKLFRTAKVRIVVVRQLVLLAKLLHNRLHFQTHIIREPRKQMVLHMAADDRNTESILENHISRQVKNPCCHLVDSLWSETLGVHR